MVKGNYDDRFYICALHNKSYNSYYKNCKKDLCSGCEIEHKCHQIISYETIVSNTNKIKEEKSIFYNKKELLKNDIKDIIDKLNNLIISIDGLFGIYEDIINNYELKKQNYYLLQNINEINKFKNTFVQDINKIIVEKNIFKKTNNMIDLYNKINLPNNVYYKIVDLPSIDIVETSNNEIEIEKPFYLNEEKFQIIQQ